MRVGGLGSGEDSFLFLSGVEEDLLGVLGYLIKVYCFRAAWTGGPNSRRMGRLERDSVVPMEGTFKIPCV